MLKTISLVSALLLSASAFGEMRAWNFKNGRSIEAEFVAFAGEMISLKSLKGKIKKIPRTEFSEMDLEYIELLNPPKLDLSVGKKTNQRIYPPTYNDQELPRQTIYSFTAKVVQKSNKPYSRKLTVEFFNIGEENNGKKNILYSYQKEDFTLDGSGSSFQVTSKEIAVTSYVSYGQRRGETYTGYMIIVTDERGEIIASKATRDDWLSVVENLRKVPVTRSFDAATGERCFPTQPAKFY